MQPTASMFSPTDRMDVIECASSGDVRPRRQTVEFAFPQIPPNIFHEHFTNPNNSPVPRFDAVPPSDAGG